MMLIASCIRQKPEILREFLESLDGLEKPEGYEYFFVLSDLEEASRKILSEWSIGKPVETETMDFGDTYITDEDTHHWTSKLVSNVIEMKRRILERAKGYDHLLLVDSDTYLHPETLTQLLCRGKDIITEISWTKWYADDPHGALPSAWFYPKYGFPPDGLERLRKEPLVKVGGFGGLYLISRKALETGVSFERTKDAPEDWGEDRFFAVRAQGRHFDLWCDTTLPSFHIYRMSDLPRLQGWKENGFKERPMKLVAMMLTYNDEDRYLKRGLEDLSRYVDEIVILDGGSTDKTVEICRSYPKVVVHQTEKPMVFGVDDEYLVREEMYRHALERDPDWVLVIDSDQIMEDRFKSVVRDLIADEKYDWYGFCLCDMWSETQYRVDGAWSPDSRNRAWRHLFRVKPDASPEYMKEKEHCGDAPAYVINAPADRGLETDLRIRHYAYATPEGRKAKYEHHIKGPYAWHAKTILDPPTLKDWNEETPKPAEEAKRGGVLISVPNTGQVKTELVSVLLNSVMRNPQLIGVDLPQGMPVDSSRNNAVKRFLGSRFEWLLFIDSDIVPPIDVVDRLLRHGKKIVSGVCWSSMGGEKGGEWEQDILPYPTVMERDEHGKGWHVDRAKLESPETLISVDAVGMSCILIHREVLEKMGGNWFRLGYGPDGICDGGEDFTWCLKAKNLGYEVWVDKSVQCGHYRTVDLLKINQVLEKTAQSPQRVENRGIEIKVLDCRWGTRSELEQPLFRKIIKEIKAHDYIHPLWSRAWEYPYTYFNADLRNDLRVLDVGPGRNPFKLFLGSRCGEVHCVDKEAIELPEGSGIIFKQCDMIRLPYPDNHFDGVFCISVLEHAEEQPAKYVAEMLRVLRPGGRLLLTIDVNRWSTPWKFKPAEAQGLCRSLGVELPPQPKDILRSEDHPEGKEVGEGLSVIGFTIQKLR